MELRITEFERILIVAPHPDDESIGTGGLLYLFGNQCDILLVTDGRKGHGGQFDVSDEECIAVRMQEIERVMGYVGANKLIKLGIPDGEVYKNEERFYGVQFNQYGLIVIPYRYDKHKDHFYTNKYVRKACVKQKVKAEVLEYEVWTPIREPNVFLNISDAIDKKIKLINCYSSQTFKYDYISLATGLNKYRGAINRVQYAEAFQKIMASDLKAIILKIKRCSSRRFR